MSNINLINEFPETGGIGTKIFTYGGIGIMLCAVIALILCLYFSKKNDK